MKHNLQFSMMKVMNDITKILYNDFYRDRHPRLLLRQRKQDLNDKKELTFQPHFCRTDYCTSEACTSPESHLLVKYILFSLYNSSLISPAVFDLILLNILLLHDLFQDLFHDVIKNCRKSVHRVLTEVNPEMTKP